MKKPADPAERKRKQREHQARMGAKEVRFIAYEGTLSCIDDLVKHGGFHDKEEMLTQLIHTAHRVIRDTSQNGDNLESDGG